VSSGREAHGKENPRKLYAAGLRTEPASLVRGSSRRITIMRFRPANIRVKRRENEAARGCGGRGLYANSIVREGEVSRCAEAVRQSTTDDTGR